MVDLRLEYPRPQAVRADWLCLNGEWEFAIDNEMVGVEKKYFEKEHLDGKIIVPYCPESVLSGIGNTDFMNAVWYRKSVTLPESYKGKRLMLHFGAVDYEAHVYVNGKEVGMHEGGYTPFRFEITDYVKEGENSICLYAKDDVRSYKQAAGKQSPKLASYGCFYTRTTGIWQTVWIEPVESGFISSFYIDTNISAPSVSLRVRTDGAYGEVLTVKTFFDGKETGEGSVKVSSEETFLSIPLSETHLWEVGRGGLYDMTLTLSGGDKVDSYFGLREVSLSPKGMRINGKVVFGRWVLDQGFYPDGIYTAPSDAALRKDIEDSMALGFNGARMHEKVFEPRYLYYADLLGYTVWGEYPNWTLDIHDYSSIGDFLPGWIESMERDYNHPALIGWCPFNETWDIGRGRQCDRVLADVYRVTKALDATRPCIDTSGNFHVLTDIYDVHNYEQDPVEFAKPYEKRGEGILEEPNFEGTDVYRGRQRYDGKLPIFVSEYGGIKWDVEADASAWGYGASVKNEREFIDRYKGLTDVLLDNAEMIGFCYTQLYDVEQERNGLMTYDRRFKFDPKIFYDINMRKAKIEEND